jgi:hypothetical protein
MQPSAVRAHFLIFFIATLHVFIHHLAAVQISTLFFYTSCTLTKSVAPPTHLCAGNLSNGSMLARQAEWCSRVDAWEGERRTARELYSGGHWNVVRDLASARPGLQCFVISAGYGLVSIDASLAPYAATFAFGHHDSVAHALGRNAPQENVEWWNALCSWRPVGVKGVRSIYGSLLRARTSIHVFALSAFYLNAIGEDLARGRQQLADNSRLIIVSTGKARHSGLNANVIPAPAELQTLLGGGLVSLNVRTARAAINSIPISDLTFEEVRKFVGDLASRAKPRILPKRSHASDDEVIYFIKNAIREERKPSYTNVLRSFRSSGWACEMKRFKSLFQETVRK